MTERLPELTIYTDGGCRPNPGPGGWGAVLLRADGTRRELSGGEAETTNNRMEIRAACEALRALEEPHAVELYTDSEYLRKGVTEWLPRWRANSWCTAGKKPVKNVDLWQRLAAELERHRVRWHWVPGHSGERWNEVADRLASQAIPRPELPVVDPEAVHLFTAAAHSGKRQAGGWAVLLRFGDRERTLSERVAGATPNRMHLQGAVAGLGAIKRSVRIHLYTCSDYLKDGATAWVSGWKARGWTTRDGKPVSHRDLWLALDRLCRRHDVNWHVVSKDDELEEMDQVRDLARAAVHGDEDA